MKKHPSHIFKDEHHNFQTISIALWRRLIMEFSQQKKCPGRWSGLHLFLKNFSKVLNASDAGEKRTIIFWDEDDWQYKDLLYQ